MDYVWGLVFVYFSIIPFKCISHCWHLGKEVRSGRTPLIIFFLPKSIFLTNYLNSSNSVEEPMVHRICFGICDFFSLRKLSLLEQKLLMGILLAYRRVWCYSQKQGATGRNQCSSLGFLYSQGRQKNCKRNEEALNFSIQLWNAPWRSICMTDPGEALVPRPRLVCVNSWFFRWWPVTLCIGNTVTERGSGFIQRTPKW